MLPEIYDDVHCCFMWASCFVPHSDPHVHTYSSVFESNSASGTAVDFKMKDFLDAVDASPTFKSFKGIKFTDVVGMT